MGWFGKSPINAEIGSKSHDKDPVTLLRDAIIGGIQHTKIDIVAQAPILAAFMMSHKSRVVIVPILA
jgi:hypothetical protein